MKIKKSIGIISLVLAGVTASFLWLGCTGSATTQTPTQTTTVQRGNLTTYINASGNLAFSTTQDLAFGQSGQVAQINVQVGDNITRGEVLAKLDTTDLEQAVDSANLSVQSAQIALTVAQNAQSNINSAQIDLQNTQNNLAKLSYPYDFGLFNLDVPAAVVAIHDAQLALNLAAVDLQGSAINFGDALGKFRQAQDSLDQAQERLTRGVGIDNFLSGIQSGRFAITDYWTLAAAQIALQKSQLTLNQTKNTYQTGLEQANVNVASAQNNLAKAQRNLQEAIITAPFTGIVTAVNISAGQLMGSGQIAISIADPAKLEADVLVNEVDIPWVTTQSRATLQLDAVPSVNIPAKITDIAPTATVQSGVVNFTVTIEVQSITIASSGTSGATSANQTGPGQRPTPGANQAAPASIQLREGLSVTANIVRDERRGVLLVPSRAIRQQGGTSFVQVVKSDGTIEQRTVQTGLTDGQTTEIISGLSEGEKIIAQARTTTATTTPPAIRPGGGFRIGG